MHLVVLELMCLAVTALAVLALGSVLLWGLTVPGDQAVAAGDFPARLAAAALDRLPAEQDEWGRAMRAELAGVPAGPERWRFAVGIVRVVVQTRSGRLLRLRAATAVSAAVAVGAVVAAVLLLPAAALFTGVTGWLVSGYVAIRKLWGAAARPARRDRGRGVALPVARAVVLGGVLGDTAILFYAVTVRLSTEPKAWYFSVCLALLVTAYVVVVLSPPFAVDAVAVRWGLAGGLACALAWLAPDVAGVAGTQDGLSGYSWFAAVLVIPAAAAVGAAARGRSATAGAQAGLWAGLISALSMVGVAMVSVMVLHHGTTDPAEIRHWHDFGSADYATFLVNWALRGSVLMLLALPPAGLASGMAGGRFVRDLRFDPDRTRSWGDV